MSASLTCSDALARIPSGPGIADRRSRAAVGDVDQEREGRHLSRAETPAALPSRHEHALRHGEAIHRLERLLPAVEREDTADGGREDVAASVETEDALPGLPGMAE